MQIIYWTNILLSSSKSVLNFWPHKSFICLYLDLFLCTVWCTAWYPSNNIAYIYIYIYMYIIVQYSSVTQSCPTLCDPMNWSMPGLPVHHQLLEITQTHVHLVGDAIQPSNPLSSPSPPASNPSQHQSLFQWVNSSHEVAKVLESQLQHQSFQRTHRTDLL